MSAIKFTTKSIVSATRSLFELNNYIVAEHVHINGAEIDLVATPKSDPFAPTIYIEVTTEYVENTKYGKDTTKFFMIRAIDPSAICLCISSEGFTASVKERAEKSRVTIKTYAELFASFQRFGDFVSKALGDRASQDFNKTYEEPYFKDITGNQKATEWLTAWASGATDAPSWLVVLGEYGTGKTALTKIMHYRWLESYLLDTNKPFPIRIELRNFSRQFDARSLLHHFLDTNGLGHVPIDFILHLIRQGSVILILDGYDEMAQFLNLRERRACLSALADLSSGGARGLLTSRPNYFTEAEELHVFEALYRSLQDDNYFMGGNYRNYLQNELIVDSLVEKYVLERYERVLRDLDSVQTEALVKRKLENDVDGQAIVLSILRRVFRDGAEEGAQSLSGKPVIITHLLELIDIIKSSDVGHDTENLTEWLIYKMIVDQLMLRDQQRAPTISPSQRRDCLQLMAISVSRRDFKIATEE